MMRKIIVLALGLAWTLPVAGQAQSRPHEYRVKVQAGLPPEKPAARVILSVTPDKIFTTGAQVGVKFAPTAVKRVSTRLRTRHPVTKTQAEIWAIAVDSTQGTLVEDYGFLPPVSSLASMAINCWYDGGILTVSRMSTVMG
jgi:hypothetical protein